MDECKPLLMGAAAVPTAAVDVYNASTGAWTVAALSVVGF